MIFTRFLSRASLALTLMITPSIVMLFSWASNPVMANTEEGFSDWRKTELYIKIDTVFGNSTVRSKYRIQESGLIEIHTSKTIPAEWSSKVRYLISQSCKHEMGTDNGDIIQLPVDFYVQEIITQPKGGRSGSFPKNIRARCHTLESVAEEKVKHLADQNARVAAIAAGKMDQLKRAAKKSKVAALQREQILQRRKEDCTSYGFTPGTDGHAKCVMELAIAADASEKQRISNANRAAALAIQAAAANAASEAAAEDARTQRQAQALINLGSSISSGGAPYRTSTSSPTAPVSSGRYKTCSYRVAGEIVPVTVGRAELCSATKLIGGQTGYLVR